MKYLYNVPSKDLGIDFRDAGLWRSYNLDTYGNSREELLENLVIFEVDQDGEEIISYGLDDADNNVHDAVMVQIEKVLK